MEKCRSVSIESTETPLCVASPSSHIRCRRSIHGWWGSMFGQPREVALVSPTSASKPKDAHPQQSPCGLSCDWQKLPLHAGWCDPAIGTKDEDRTRCPFTP